MSLFLFALLVSANPPAVAPASQPAPVEKPKKPKKICRPVMVDTGSRMAKSKCLTQDQWDAQTQGLSGDEYQAMHGGVGH